MEEPNGAEIVPSEGIRPAPMPADDFVRRMNAITVLSVSSLLAAGLAVGLAIWIGKSPAPRKED